MKLGLAVPKLGAKEETQFLTKMIIYIILSMFEGRQKKTRPVRILGRRIFFVSLLTETEVAHRHATSISFCWGERFPVVGLSQPEVPVALKKPRPLPLCDNLMGLREVVVFQKNYFYK